jgi:hypothetical protein
MVGNRLSVNRKRNSSSKVVGVGFVIVGKGHVCLEKGARVDESERDPLFGRG